MNSVPSIDVTALEVELVEKGASKDASLLDVELALFTLDEIDRRARLLYGAAWTNSLEEAHDEYYKAT